MRWILVAVGLLLLIMVGLWSVNHYIRKDDFSVVRNAVEQRVSTAMGKPFRIHGKVGMTTSLVPTVRFEDLRLANAEWGQSEYLVTAKSFEVQLKLIPLLFGDYSVASARFDDVDMNLEIRKDGSTNWQFQTTADQEPVEFDAVFNDINVNRFNLHFVDERDGGETTIALDSFSASTDNSRDPIEIDARGTVNNNRASVSGRVGSYNQLLSGTGSLLDVSVEYKDVRIRVDGNLDGPEPTGFTPGDVHIVATGNDIMQLAEIYEFELFNTDKFSIDWHLLGTRERMRAHDVDIYLESTGNTLSIKGGTEDLIGLTEFDVNVHATGSNLNQHYGDLIDLNLPDSDSYDVKGRIARANGITSLSEIAANAVVGSAQSTASGSIMNIEELLGFDLDYQVTGENVEVLESFSGIDLPATDKFVLGGHLKGAGADLSADNLKFEVDYEELSLTANGSAANISKATGFEIDAQAKGHDLGDIDALLRPFTDFSLRESILQNPELDEAVTGSFLITGKVTGSGESLTLTDIDGMVIRDGIDIKFAGSVGELYGLDDIKLRFSVEGPDISGLNIVVPAELPKSGRFNASGLVLGSVPEVAITEFKGELLEGGHKLLFNGNIGNLSTRAGQNLNIALSGGNIRDLEAFVDLRFPPTQRYSATVILQESNGQLNLRNILFDGYRDSLKAEIRGNIRNIRGVPEFDFGIDVKGDEFGEGGIYWDMEWPQEGPFVFGATIQGTAKRISVKELHGKVGQSHFRGKATYVPGDRPAIIDARLSGQFDATPWLPETEEIQEKRQERGRMFSEKKYDYSVLRNIDLDLMVDQLSLTSGAALVTIKNGSIQLKDGVFRANPFDGKYQQAIIDLSLEIDATKAVPDFAISMVSEGFNLGLYLDQADLKDQIKGIVDISIDAKGSGSSMAQLASTANGESYLLFTQGFFPKQDLPLKVTDFIFSSFKWLGGQKDLEVHCAMSYASLANGILDQEILYVDSNQMLMGGFGKINLKDEEYDMTVAPRPKKRRFLSTDLDVNIKGSLLDPKFTLNKASAAMSGAKKYGTFLIAGPAGFLIPRSARKDGVQCANNISEFKNYVEETQN